MSTSTDFDAYLWNWESGDIILGTSATKRVWIKDDGKVGIGTEAPQGMLDVDGEIYQRGSSLHADYVFDDKYKLESIEEHSEFMWKNKHLTAIPGATTDESGNEIIKVGAHRKGIVEELEKAHIYIDMLNSSNKDLEKKNDELSDRISKLEEFIYTNMNN